ncbi:MAG: lysylphosphatidylglycerol synthase transmembrane domain-containing protein [Lautropia sp.]
MRAAQTASAAATDATHDATAESGASPTGRRYLVAGFVLGLVFLWLALRDTDPRAPLDALIGADLRWVTVAIAASLAFMALKTWRWAIMMRPIAAPAFHVLHRAVYVGTAANLLIAHSGEVLRATLVSRRQGIAIGGVMATVLVERILDLLAMVALVGIALLFDPRVSGLLWTVALIGLACVLAGVLLLLACLRPGPMLRRAMRAVLARLPSRLRVRAARQLGRADAFAADLKRPATVLRLLAISLLQWACIVAAIWASVSAVGVQTQASIAIAVFGLSIVGLTLPSPPMQLGTLQLAFVAGLALGQVDAAVALAASLVYIGCVNCTMLAIGARFAPWTFRLMRRSAATVPAARRSPVRALPS